MIVNRISLKDNLEEILPYEDEAFPYLVFYEELDQYLEGFVPWHWHEEIEFFTVIQGRLRFSTNQSTYDLAEGEGGFINSNVMHKYEPLPGSRVIVTGEVLNSTILSGGTRSYYHHKFIEPILENDALDVMIFRPSSPTHRQILSHLRASQDIADTGAFGFELEVRNHLCEVWLLISKEAPAASDTKSRTNSLNSERIKKMMLYIKTHYAERISLQDIAGAAHISEREALRCFQNNLDTTLFSFLLSYRCRAAADRLRNSSDSVTDIAYSCGFSNPSYLGKIFKQEMGVSPLQYRKEQARNAAS